MEVKLAVTRKCSQRVMSTEQSIARADTDISCSAMSVFPTSLCYYQGYRCLDSGDMSPRRLLNVLCIKREVRD